MSWIQDPQKLQAISSIAIAFLTLVFITVTWIYTSASRRMANIMTEDLAFRTEPMVEGTVEFTSTSLTSPLTAMVVVTSTHAPINVERVILSVKPIPDNQADFKLVAQSERHQLAGGRRLVLQRQFEFEGEPSEWILIMRYRSIMRKDLYETRIDSNGHVERRIIPPSQAR